MSVRGNLPYEPPSSRRRLSAWLQEKLFERRIVLVTGRLDADLAAEVAAALLTLDATGDEPIELHLDSPDGTLEAAFVLIDTLDLLHATVRAHCRGQVGGPAIGVVAAADHRSASPHTRFRLFQPTAEFSGTPDQLASDSRQQQELLWRFHARLAQVTGRPAEEIAEDMRRRRYLDAGEALAYGLIDEISGPR
jgi:ATP-dependent Clp protease protease subunit